MIRACSCSRATQATSIDEFNPTTDTITPKGSLDFHASSSSLLANGKVLVLGTDVSGLYNPDAVPPAPDFTAFDERSVPNSGILPRSGQSAVTLPGDKEDSYRWRRGLE